MSYEFSHHKKRKMSCLEGKEKEFLLHSFPAEDDY
jgi:hypothetical protein